MNLKDILWQAGKPAARALLPHWHGKPIALSPQEAAARVHAVYTPMPLFPVEIEPLPPEQLDVSVIVPVYNAAAFLEQCISSLATQCTRRRFEIIAVNDGSTDTSAAILETLARKYTRLKIVTQENGGISAARNMGISRATGRYLTFVDNDDFVSAGFIDNLLESAERTGADFVKCGYRIFDRETQTYIGQVYNADIVLQGELGENVTRYNGFVWGCLFHRSLFENIRFPVGFWYEDMITRALLLRKSRCFANVRATLYAHTEHPQTASRTVWANTSMKSLDQYFLAAALAAYGEQIGLGRENGLYAVLLDEFGTQLRTRTAALPEALQQAVFILACECLDAYRPVRPLPLLQKQLVLDDALARRNFTKWALGCLL